MPTIEKDKKITHITSEKRLQFVFLLSEKGTLHDHEHGTHSHHSSSVLLEDMQSTDFSTEQLIDS